MIGGIFIGVLIGALVALMAWAILSIEEKRKIGFKIAIISLSFVAAVIISMFIGISYENYSIKTKIAKYEIANQTYISAVNNPNVSEYEKVAILQTTIKINQEIAETKVYVNSWASIGITKENKEAVNNVQFIGQ